VFVQFLALAFCVAQHFTMRIGIDGSLFTQAPRGHSIYARRLCAELGQLLPGAEFFLYAPSPPAEVDWPGCWRVRCQSHVTARVSPVLWLKVSAGASLREDRLDLFWSPYSFLPATPRGLPTLLTIYDFVYQQSPESFHPLHRLAFRLFLQRDVRRASRVITISHGVRAQIREQLGVDSLVISPGLDARFQPPSAQAQALVRERYRLQSPYLLAVAAWDPRKNLERLVRVFLDLKQAGRLGSLQLVLVGRTDRAEQSLRELLQSPGSDQVRCLGYVADDDLPALYSGAAVFAFPSLYEGYGMPVVEALACGTRVMATNSAEIREAGGDQCHYIEPTEAGIRAGLLQALEAPAPAGPPLRRRTWRDSAQQLADEFQRLVGASR
jgi:glycosyltransferase involved in cell wall biosynthesis